jgi:hypothetical protein
VARRTSLFAIDNCEPIIGAFAMHDIAGYKSAIPQ